MVNIRELIDDARCYLIVRDLRWPDRISCPHCSASSVIKDGKGDTQLHRQRYLCHGCRERFDDLTGTIFAKHHQPLRTWIICFYCMGLNLSSLQIAKEFDIHRSDAQAMVQLLRQGVVDCRPAVVFGGRGRVRRSVRDSRT